MKYCFFRAATVKIRFGPFTFDLDTRQLTQGAVEIRLSPKAFELLATLVLDRPRVLSKAVLLKRLWPETFVEEANLSNLVAEIREALGDQARAPSYVRTAHGFGYAFCGDTTMRTPPSSNSLFLPVNGQVSAKRSPPLSLVKMMIVFSVKPFASNVCRTRPICRSMAWIMR
jgi:DNA-binding winged helix-turn-helix (wHTH) protein